MVGVSGCVCAFVDVCVSLFVIVWDCVCDGV